MLVFHLDQEHWPHILVTLASHHELVAIVSVAKGDLLRPVSGYVSFAVHLVVDILRVDHPQARGQALLGVQVEPVRGLLAVLCVQGLRGSSLELIDVQLSDTGFILGDLYKNTE